jgi:signal transduction histidine kinase
LERVSIRLEADAMEASPRYRLPVRDKSILGLPLLDALLASALFAIKLATLAAGVQPGPAAMYASLPFWTLPFAFRRRYPVAVAAVVAVTGALEYVAVGYHDSVVALFAWVFVAYNNGARIQSPRRLALATAISGAAGVSVGIAHGPRTLWNVVALLFLLLAPLLAGLWVRQLRLRAVMLEQLAQQLEREREEQARSAVTEERARIARELHDEVAHAMSVIAVQADAAEGALATDPALVERPLVAIRETARAALADMRRVLGGLRSGEDAELTPGPGLERIGMLVEQARADGLEVDLRIEGEPAPLPQSLDLAAYRVLQEGLTNVRKHAGARQVEIVVRYGPDTVAVAVVDDGDGTGAGGGTGRGLPGLRERVTLLGGELVVGPRSGGFALRATLPLA